MDGRVRPAVCPSAGAVESPRRGRVPAALKLQPRSTLRVRAHSYTKIQWVTGSTHVRRASYPRPSGETTDTMSR